MKLFDGTELTAQWTPHVASYVWLREGTVDREVWADTFTGLYHVPPERRPPPETVLDLGANIGLVSAHYRFLWPDASILAVEMDPGNAAVARVNSHASLVWETAVAATAGDDVPYDATGRTDSFRLDPTGASRTHAETVDGIIRATFKEPVDFVKMDVEGAEWKIFEKVEEWAPLVRSLLVELHGDSSSDTLVEVATIFLLGDGRFERVVRHERHPQAVYATR